eukprot:1161508-Pelagomonas_calceolata.AAC.15
MQEDGVLNRCAGGWMQDDADLCGEKMQRVWWPKVLCRGGCRSRCGPAWRRNARGCWPELLCRGGYKMMQSLWRTDAMQAQLHVNKQPHWHCGCTMINADVEAMPISSA